MHTQLSHCGDQNRDGLLRPLPEMPVRRTRASVLRGSAACAGVGREKGERVSVTATARFSGLAVMPSVATFRNGLANLFISAAGARRMLLAAFTSTLS